MSASYRTRASSGVSHRSAGRDRNAPSTTMATTGSSSQQPSTFDACSATASYFVYAQRNIILCLHYDILNVDRRFEKHKEDVLIIEADNVSERGAGRLIVSYDVGQTAIVWDLFTGEEVARFASFEQIYVAAWMRDGSVAFGNTQGNVILFEPSTSEHVSARTIFDPITALAPASDCRTFAIGYQNGSILIATLQPSFTILHTLNTSRGPSPIINLAWHGSSSKQKADMLATQTQDGDLRVWSISKPPHNEQPRIIRLLDNGQMKSSDRNWFAWSKNGRIVHHSDGDTRSWDVRTKRITSETVPTVDNVIAIANYGPTATLFTVCRNHTVQQYDLISPDGPGMVANVQHVPANAPPTPPDSIEEYHAKAVQMQQNQYATPALPIQLDTDTSEDEGSLLSPLQKIVQEMDQIEEEMRDQLGPLSPVSSRASSRASMSSASSYGRRSRKRRPAPSTSTMSDGTNFSINSSVRSGGDSISIRSGTSVTSSKNRSSTLRQELMRSPDEAQQMKFMDLFPFTKARLSEVKFKTPQYSQPELTPDVLRAEMISVIFGWDHDIEALIRNECASHQPGSASGILLSKWLGDAGADALSQMIGTETMSSADWMVLAFASQINQGTQNNIGEAFVRKLLESNEVHPAVAILLGLGEHNEAVEVYVSRKYYMEAVLLTCLCFPNDWQRQSHLVRKWGENAIAGGDAELAVRCFACTSAQPTEAWFSPRAQDAVYKEQQRIFAPETLSPPVSPPSATNPNRMTTKNASLKLITSFDAAARGAVKKVKQPTTAIGITPIADTAITPGGAGKDWRRAHSRGVREESQTRTATPGGYARARMPSTQRGTSRDVDATPMLEKKSRFTPAHSDADGPISAIPITKLRDDESESDVPPVSARPRDASTRRAASRARNPSRNRNELQIQTYRVEEREEALSPHPSTTSRRTRDRQSSTSHGKTVYSEVSVREDDPISPSQLTGNSTASYKGRAIDRYLSDLESNYQSSALEAQPRSRGQSRQDSRNRGESTDRRSRSRARPSEGRSSDVRHIKPGKKSPTSPKAMGEEVHGRESSHNEDQYLSQDQLPIRARERSRAASRRPQSPERETIGDRAKSRAEESRARSRARSRHTSGEEASSSRARSHARSSGSDAQSPVSPASIPVAQPTRELPLRSAASTRQRSTSRRPTDSHSRARSSSRRPSQLDLPIEYDDITMDNAMPTSPEHPVPSDTRRPRNMSRKELAARELEERRLSLARRPSVPPIPNPSELAAMRPLLSGRSMTSDNGELLSSRSFASDISRSQTVDPDAMQRYNRKSEAPQQPRVNVGLPATPRAMRHPRYQHSVDGNDKEAVPAMPSLPDNIVTLASVSYQPSGSTSAVQESQDDIAPLLPSSVYGQKLVHLPARSSSAPPEKFSHRSASSKMDRSPPERQRRDSSRSTHARKASDRESVQSQNAYNVLASAEANNSAIVIVEEPDIPMPFIAELQHLAGPPPPPPPPTIFSDSTASSQVQPVTQVSASNTDGVIDIAIASTPALSEASTLDSAARSIMSGSKSPPTTFQSMQRRTQTPDGVQSKWRNMTDRIRSSSKSRAKSPPIEYTSSFPAPYESILPSQAITTAMLARTKSPGEAGYIAPYESVPPPPPPAPLAPLQMGLSEAANPAAYASSNEPIARSASASVGGYRSPKEIRANMPPDTLQAGVYVAPGRSGNMEGGMI